MVGRHAQLNCPNEADHSARCRRLGEGGDHCTCHSACSEQLSMSATASGLPGVTHKDSLCKGRVLKQVFSGSCLLAVM